ncbi:MAG TPA: hypothetical protein VHC22_13215 [Pirellulales bacterium]|nr:hypothetical protein [Pirellulales bacterium]
MSYANGCDHLGRCYPRMESPRLVDRLFLRDLARIVDATASLSADTVAMLIRSDWSSVLSRVASDRGLSKSQPSARQTNWSEWRL